MCFSPPRCSRSKSNPKTKTMHLLQILLKWLEEEKKKKKDHFPPSFPLRNVICVFPFKVSYEGEPPLPPPLPPQTNKMGKSRRSSSLFLRNPHFFQETFTFFATLGDVWIWGVGRNAHFEVSNSSPSKSPLARDDSIDLRTPFSLSRWLSSFGSFHVSSVAICETHFVLCTGNQKQISWNFFKYEKCHF